MPVQNTRLVLFTRYPDPGQAKTRLIPAIGAEGAAKVHKKLTENTVDLLRRNGQPVEIHFSGGDIGQFTDWLGCDAKYVAQPDGDLTIKLLAALEPAPLIFFGSDTPDLKQSHIQKAMEGLDIHDLIIGPAEDGGYYLIGMREHHSFLFEGIPWSTNAVLKETLQRAEKHNLSVKLLETLSDCDRPEDLSRWPWLIE